MLIPIGVQGANIAERNALGNVCTLNANWYIAEERGHIIGAVIGGWDGRHGWIYHLAVSPHLQCQGIGLQLMEEVEKRLQQRGAVEINLLVEGRNTQVVPFYQRLGFQIGNKVFMSKSLVHCQRHATRRN